MQDDTTQNGDNGNGNGSRVFEDMTLGEFAKILFEEIRDVRNELQENIGAMELRLAGRMDRLEVRSDEIVGRIDTMEKGIGALPERMDKLGTDFQSLHMAVHQNQITFMNNHKELEKRFEVLEEKAA